MNKPVGWRGEPIKHGLASQGIKTTYQQPIKYASGFAKNELPEELQLDLMDYRKKNLDKIIKLFWWCGVNNEWDKFNFDHAFAVVEDVLYTKLGNHFRLPSEEQKKFFEVRLDGIIKGRPFSYFQYAWTDFSLEEREEIIDELITPEVEKAIEDKIPAYHTFVDIDLTVDIIKNKIIKGEGMGLSYLDDIADVLAFKENFIELVSDENFGPNGDYDIIRNMWGKIQRREDYNDVELFDESIHLVHHHGHIFDIYLEEVVGLTIEKDGLIHKLREDFEGEYL